MSTYVLVCNLTWQRKSFLNGGLDEEVIELNCRFSTSVLIKVMLVMFSLLGLPHYMGLSWFIPEHEVISPNIKSIG